MEEDCEKQQVAPCQSGCVTPDQHAQVTCTAAWGMEQGEGVLGYLAPGSPASARPTRTRTAAARGRMRCSCVRSENDGLWRTDSSMGSKKADLEKMADVEREGATKGYITAKQTA